MSTPPRGWLWAVYHEPADSDTPRTLIEQREFPGADTEGRALELAAHYYEIPSHDLVVKRVDLRNRGEE